jgi:hypothetical protein
MALSRAAAAAATQSERAEVSDSDPTLAPEVSDSDLTLAPVEEASEPSTVIVVKDEETQVLADWGDMEEDDPELLEAQAQAVLAESLLAFAKAEIPADAPGPSIPASAACPAASAVYHAAVAAGTCPSSVSDFQLGPHPVCESGAHPFGGKEQAFIWRVYKCRAQYRNRRQWGKGKYLTVEGKDETKVHKAWGACFTQILTGVMEEPEVSDSGSAPLASSEVLDSDTKAGSAARALIRHPCDLQKVQNAEEQSRADRKRQCQLRELRGEDRLWKSWRSAEWQDDYGLYTPWTAAHGTPVWFDDDWSWNNPLSGVDWTWSWNASTTSQPASSWQPSSWQPATGWSAAPVTPPAAVHYQGHGWSKWVVPTAAAAAGASTTPAARPCPSKDIRLKQDSSSSGVGTAAGRKSWTPSRVGTAAVRKSLTPSRPLLTPAAKVSKVLQIYSKKMAVHFTTFGQRDLRPRANEDRFETVHRDCPAWLNGCRESAVLFLNCSRFPHFDTSGTHQTERHCGKAPHVMRPLVLHPYMRDLMHEFRGFLMEMERTEVERIAILPFCTWGKHRSVAVAELLHGLLTSLRFGDCYEQVNMPWHTKEATWTGCGPWRCPACLREGSYEEEYTELVHDMDTLFLAS